MRAFHLKMMAGISVIAMGAAPLVAMAQEEAARGGIEDIVVTAQKKQENLQDVPISVSAVGGDKIANMNLTSLQGLANSVPNVQIDNFANTPQTAVFSIRGIGVIEPDPYAGNTVGIVVDGVPQFFSMGALLDTYDVERVEILRGPQGTLFGANTTGGVVNVMSKRPSGEFGGYVKGTYGNWDRFDLAAAFDAPIVEDKLALRVAGIHSQREGWVTNTYNGESMGDKNLDAVRAILQYTPNNDLKITLQGEYVATRNGSPVVVNGGLPGEGNYVPAGTYWNGMTQVAPGTPGASLLPMYASPCASGGRCVAPDDFFSGNNEVPDISNMNTYMAIGTIEWANTPIGDITAITGYKKFDLLEYTDQDGTAKSNNSTRRATEAWQFSQEIRTSADITDKFNLTAGVYFLKNHYNHYQMYHLDFAYPGLTQYNEQEQSNYSISGFLQTYYQLTDRLKLQAGIRYSHEQTKARSYLDYSYGFTPLTSDAFRGETHDRDVTLLFDDGFNFVGLGDYNTSLYQYDFTAPLAAGQTNYGAVLVAPNSAFTVGGKKKWNNVGWKLGLDYELGDNQLVYASWTRGFKSGGFTGRVGVPADGDTPYNPEKVDTFEAGIKADFFDRRLRANFAAFYTNYRNMQVAQIYFDPDTNVQGNRILNAGKSEIKGFELEVTAVPVDGLTLRGSLAYLDAKYKEFLYFDPVEATNTDLRGYDLQNAPKWSSTLGINYSYALPNDARIVADASWSYTAAKYYTAILDTPRSQVQPTYYVDALLTYHAPDDKYSVGLWGKNLLDKRYISTAYDSPGYTAIVGYAPPRQYGVSVTVNF